MQRGEVTGSAGATIRRGGARKAAGDRRAPLPASVSKTSKRERGRGDAPPANIRATGVELSPDERTTIREKLGRKLGKFAASIERVSVRVQDVNGPRGGVDHECRIKVVLSDLSSVVVAEQDASVGAAIARAVAAAERATRRAVQRRRSTKTRSRSAPRTRP
ncbi:MAG TPA: HPF/RaiA family ribosome-associated protein [Anaeromyxobacteraceae bacterium]|nr:HPF/RaiA family ribosome-associated protein [Anaeromyxobacteraceae bacterium]